MKLNKPSSPRRPSTARGGSRGRGSCAFTDEQKIQIARDVIRRTEIVVNDTLTAWQIKEIHRLLKQREPQLSYAVIATRASKPNNPVSENAVAFEAYKIGEKRSRGRKPGVSPSRPARYSKNREQVLQLKKDNPDWTNQQIGDAVQPKKLTRAAVSRLLLQAKSDEKRDK